MKFIKTLLFVFLSVAVSIGATYTPVTVDYANALISGTAVYPPESFDLMGSASTAQAYAIQRANHTGTQLAATISDFTTAVNLLLPTTLPATGGTAATISGTIPVSQVGGLQTDLNGLLPLTGGTITGDLTVTGQFNFQDGNYFSSTDGSGNFLTLNANGTYYQLSFQNNFTDVWHVGPYYPETGNPFCFYSSNLGNNPFTIRDNGDGIGNFDTGNWQINDAGSATFQSLSGAAIATQDAVNTGTSTDTVLTPATSASSTLVPAGVQTALDAKLASTGTISAAQVTGTAATLASNNTFLGANNTAPNQVGQPPADSTLLVKAQADTLYPTIYKVVLANDLIATTADWVESTENVTIPVGHYLVTGALAAETASTTSGVLSIVTGQQNMDINLVFVTNSHYPSGTVTFDYGNNGTIIQAQVAAPSTRVCSQGTGIVGFYYPNTIRLAVRQNVLDTANSAKLVKGSCIIFTKLP